MERDHEYEQAMPDMSKGGIARAVQTEPKSMSHLEEAQCELNDATSSLHDAIGELQRRLAPILLPEREDEAKMLASLERVRESSSPTVERIHDEAQRVRIARNLLANLLDRLTV